MSSGVCVLRVGVSRVGPSGRSGFAYFAFFKLLFILSPQIRPDLSERVRRARAEENETKSVELRLARSAEVGGPTGKMSTPGLRNSVK